MSEFYYLNDNHTVRECSRREWSDQFQEMCKNKKRHIAKDIIEDKFISTVWLGTNHNFLGGSPHLFETMIFEGDISTEIYCERYSSWDDAIEGHKKAIKWVLDGCKNAL